MQISQSRKLFSIAQKVMPGGVNSPVRAFKSVQSDPIFISHAKGSLLYDNDGNSFIDYIGSWGPMILGHADPRITSEIEKALQKGTSFGAPTEGEITLDKGAYRLRLLLGNYLHIPHSEPIFSEEIIVIVN